MINTNLVESVFAITNARKQAVVKVKIYYIKEAFCDTSHLLIRIS